MKTRPLFLVCVCVQVVSACYWNADIPYLLYSTKTPYDTVRGDIRDHPVLPNCDAVSIWTLNRHGNRNPSNSDTENIQNVAVLRDEIVASHEAGRGQLCAQDIENFRRWTWNETLAESQSFALTKTGYEELLGVGRRLRQKYPHLLQGSNEDYYFRANHDQRNIASAVAFVQGLTEDLNLTLTPDVERPRDAIVSPDDSCDRYQKTVETSQQLKDQMTAYKNSAEYFAVKNAVQNRLGITTQLSLDDIYSIYETCSLDRSWSDIHQSPWCAAFSNQDLVVLEYRDDVRLYYKGGYGSWVNVKLGNMALKDLYDNFEAVVRGHGKKVVSYFTHKTTLEMAFSAMGMFKDAGQLQGSYRNPDRLWRTSYLGAFSVNMIAVLNRCNEVDSQSYRVQLFVNEKETELCPSEGCTWQQFQDQFKNFKSADLDFCSMDYRIPETEVNGASVVTGFFLLLFVLTASRIDFLF